MTNPNSKFDLVELLKRYPYDPGRITPNDMLYGTDITYACAKKGGGLMVCHPRYRSQIHPYMATAIAKCVLTMDAWEAAERENGIASPLILTADVHPPHHPGSPDAYRHQDPFSTITRSMLDSWTARDLRVPGHTLDQFKRHLDIVPEHTMHVYTRHGVKGTLDTKVIPELMNHRAKKIIASKGNPISPLSGFPAEQYALGMLDTRESTGDIERWVSEGVKRVFIMGFLADICCAWKAYATRVLSEYTIDVVYLVDAMISLGVRLTEYDSTETELKQLGLDTRYWIKNDPDCPEPITLEQFWGAKLRSVGVKFSSVDILYSNMKALL